MHMLGTGTSDTVLDISQALKCLIREEKDTFW